MQKSFGSLFVLSCFLFCLAAFVGCGKNDGLCSVEGTVTLDGAPVADGTINFGPMAGQHGTATGAKIVDGKYSARASEGEMVVSVYAYKMEKIENPTEDDIAHGVTERQVNLVPEKYNRQSELKCTIKSGKNTVDFDLKSGE